MKSKTSTARRQPGSTARSAAFFDTDGVIFPAVCLTDFLEFWISWADVNARHALRAIRNESARGTDPTALNRMCFTLLSGSSYGRLVDAGTAWFEDRRKMSGAFRPGIMSIIAHHRSHGDLIVLVSSSFEPCVHPIAVEIGADQTICSEPAVDSNGNLTGEVLNPIVDRAKARAVCAVAKEARINPAACFAYGSQSIDIEMLRTVGHPHVVGDNIWLTAQAEASGWPRLRSNVVMPRHPEMPALTG